MLPTLGYFKNIICPFCEEGKCERVYCHFKHRKPDKVFYVPTPIYLLEKTKYTPTLISEINKNQNNLKNNETNENDEIIIKNENNEIIIKNENNESDLDGWKKSKTNLNNKNSETKHNLHKDETTNAELVKQETEKSESLHLIEELSKLTRETKAKNGDNVSKEIVKKKYIKNKEKSLPIITESEQQANPVVKKVRIAHKTNMNSMAVVVNKRSLTPAQIMINRFVTSNDTLKDKTKSNETTSNSFNKKRVAHTPSVNLDINISKSKDIIPKRPVIPIEIGGKISNVIRQRYLNLIIDECLKTTTFHEHAYEKALNEEKLIFKRSSNKNVYLNLAVNAIKRIRDSAKKN